LYSFFLFTQPRASYFYRMAIMNATGTQYRKLVVTGIRQEADHVKSFTFRAADGEALHYEAGQFITFVFTSGGKEERRSYSFSSAPVLNEAPAITLKRVPNGLFSRLLTDRTRIGDEFTVIDPSGFFTLPGQENDYRQLFFFAAGIGITPVFSIIKTVLHTQPHMSVVLYYSNRSVTDTVFYNELEALQQQFGERLHIVYLFSTAKNLFRARLGKGLVPELLNEYSKFPVSQQLYYLCGPFEYMRMVILALEERGIPAAQVKKENFVTTTPRPRLTPPDTDAHAIHIRFAAKNYTLSTQYPQTILQAAKQQGIALPYSCEAGQCGTCVATCTSGKVWMSYNEVLTDADIAKGRILTCTGFPVGGDVEIVI
jgi:ring-1,2-phenylacetyl-CoA epoxidase subunit PaaE